jgi:GntR family transcriptional regulator / MocR family aminotransferase
MRAAATPTLIALLERDPPNRLLSGRLQNALRRLISEGHVEEGERLPSSRLLAREADVARDTVEAAYRQLELEGFLDRRPGSGTYVAAIAHGFIAGKTDAAGRRARPDLRASLSARGKPIAASGGVPDHGDAHPFVILPDVQQFPLDIWRKLMARVLTQHDRQSLLYADALGLPGLREEIARYLGAYRGVRCSGEQIVVLASSQAALSLIANLLLDRGDVIAVENPGFHGARLAFQSAGLTLAPIPVDADGIATDRLLAARERPRAVYVTPSHQYPTGATLTLERRLALIHWAERHKTWIVEDDYDSEFRYDGRPVAAIQGLDPTGRVLYLGTFSKVLFPGLRLAYLVLPESLVPAFVAGRTLIDGHSAMIAQAVLAAFIREGHFTAYIRRMRLLYRARRDSFLDAFERHLSPYAEMLHRAGGLHIASHLRDGLDETETVAAACGVGVELPTLKRLYLGGETRQGWLMGFAALSPHQAEDAMRRLAGALGRLKPGTRRGGRPKRRA